MNKTNLFAFTSSSSRENNKNILPTSESLAAGVFSDPLCLCLRQGTFAHLLVLVFLQVPRGDQALWVDVCGDGLDELGVRVHVLHLEEGQNVLHLQVVRAVRHGLPFGGQATCGHPVGVLLLLWVEGQAKDSFHY